MGGSPLGFKFLTPQVKQPWNGESVQTEVNAAVAEGASATSQFVVEAMPGATMDYTPAPNVHVLDMRALAAATTTEGALRPLPVIKQGHPFLAPYPAIIALRCDDGDDFWVETNNAFDGISPADYCKLYNVPVSIAIRGDKLTDAAFLSAAELTTLYTQYGFEMGGHGYSRHDAGPTTRTQMLEEVIRSKTELENVLTVTWAKPNFYNTGNGAAFLPTLGTGAQKGVYTLTCTATASNGGTFSVTDPYGVALTPATVGVAYTGQINFTIADGAIDFAVGDTFTVRVGSVFPCRGWIEPGWPNVAEDYYVNSVHKLDKEMGLALRTTYEWSQNWVTYNTASPWQQQPVRHGQMYARTLNSTTTEAMMDDMLEWAQCPGTRTCVMFHTLDATGAVSSANFKLFLDKLIVLRNQRKLYPVTLSTYYDAQLQNPTYKAADGTMAEMSRPFLPNGRFEMADILNYTDGSYQQGCIFRQNAPGTTSLVASSGNTLHDYAAGNCLQMTQGASTGVQLVMWRTGVEPGYIYGLEFDAKRIVDGTYTNAAKVNVTIDCDGASWTAYNIELTDDWSVVRVPFGLVTTSAEWCTIKIAAAAIASSCVQIDNVTLCRQ